MKTNYTYPDLIVLGSTGSVGTQAVDVARGQTAQGHHISIRGVTAHRDVATIEDQIREFYPDFAVMTNETAAADLRIKVADTNTTVLAGYEGIREMLGTIKTENPLGITVENSILGEAGLLPTLYTLEAGHRLALANKESLVVGGELVMALCRAKGQEILPVDSEHCAIFQCMRAGRTEEVRKIWLTASGGPFYGYTREQLLTVTKTQTLAHPTWKMGAKITVDSATLMNKGFEVIEAVHLFGVKPKDVEVVVHRESMIHSMVEYNDYSIIAQMSVPDMRHCVQYALTHPYRTSAEGVMKPLNLFDVGKLTFARPDLETFPLLKLAMDAITVGGAVPAALNAANEVVVAAFLQEKIRFCEISEYVTRVVEDLKGVSGWHSYDGIMEADKLARQSAEALIGHTKDTPLDPT
ncbi:MAG: 1-deoxy-D-xylulose-5-phosphate reductoisomerase [Ruminococcaceae bacterium]|nr:1-deoxy-D-xylulose-5-phosphate reductoisomerase [Oscillospiraceae bacterium]